MDSNKYRRFGSIKILKGLGIMLNKQLSAAIPILSKDVGVTRGIPPERACNTLRQAQRDARGSVRMSLTKSVRVSLSNSLHPALR